MCWGGFKEGTSRTLSDPLAIESNRLSVVGFSPNIAKLLIQKCTQALVLLNARNRLIARGSLYYVLTGTAALALQ
jgi:hypothetical protein